MKSPPYESLSIVSIQELDSCTSCHSGNCSMKEDVSTAHPNPTESHSIFPSTNFGTFDTNFKTDQCTEASHCIVDQDFLGNVDDLERNRIVEEINSTLRSLETNLILTSTFLVLLLVLFFLPNIISVVVISVMKGMIPLITSITNFGKVKTLFHSYVGSFGLKIQTLVK